MEECSLAGKNVLVTGASAGIGRACALAFAREGANVMAAALPGAELDALPALAEAPGRIETRAGDLTDDPFLDRLAAGAGGADVLIHSAGLALLAPFLESDPDDWDRMFAVNVRALMRLSLLVSRGMAERGGGHLILISSALAHAVYPNTLAYAATKHAVHAIHTGFRLELGRHGIRSTELRPGLVGDTNIREASKHPSVVENVANRPYKPIASADIARAAVFAARTPPGVDIDILEVKPVGQP